MKALLYCTEVLIGYGPIMVLWLAGIGMGLPFSVAGMITGEPIAYLMFLSLTLGGIGMWGIIQLLKKMIWRDIDYPISKYRTHLILGCLAIVFAAVGIIRVDGLISIFLAAPILVTWHFYQICKHTDRE